MNNLPKCTSNSYNKDPFYLIKDNDTLKTYIVHLNDEFRIRILLSGFINSIDSIVDLTIRSYEDPFNPIVYRGCQEKNRIHVLLTEFEDVIFHNGYHDLIFRNPDTNESITFDEHGLIFMDTNTDYSDVLKNLGAELKQSEKLISKSFHWHHSSESLNERLFEFISVVGLVKEESADRSEPE